MPVISKFNGIVIKMYFLQSEHNPPHIHAFYENYAIAVDFQTGKVLDGYLPTAKLKMVLEWISVYKDELSLMWVTQSFKRIPPLS